MKWWLTKMIFRVEIGNGRHTPQFDEQLRLFIAPSKKEAIKKSKLAGENEETSFFNTKSELVKWRYLHTTEVHQLDEPVDGMEIYSRIEEADDAESYLFTAGLKAKHLLQFTEQATEPVTKTIWPRLLLQPGNS